MNKYIKLKAVAILVGSGLAGTSLAHNNEDMNNNGTSTTKDYNTQVIQRTDAAITSDVNASLADHSGMVTVLVKNGVVLLTGQLPSDTDYEKVITLAESIKGVRDVNVDKLTVKDSNQPLNDIYITAKVKGALIKADIMGKDIPSWSIGVETKNGQVFLSGKIASKQEKQKVLEVVKSVKGVTKVDDQIVVGYVESSSTTTINRNETTN